MQTNTNNTNKVLVVLVIILLFTTLYFAFFQNKQCFVKDLTANQLQNLNPISNPADTTNTIDDTKVVATPLVDTTTPAKKSGINGTVVATSCPGMVPEGTENPCNTRNYPNLDLSIKDTSTGAVKYTKSDSAGKFKIDLDPGTYDIGQKDTKNLYLTGGITNVKVSSGIYTNINVPFTVLNQ